MHQLHLHRVVPGGGLSPKGTGWVAFRPGFFLQVRVLSRLFRRLFLQDLDAASDVGTLRLAGAVEALRHRPARHRRVKLARCRRVLDSLGPITPPAVVARGTAVPAGPREPEPPKATLAQCA